MDPLRLYLFAGLIAHKVLWELLKRNEIGAKQPLPWRVKLVKAIKIGILGAVLAQTLLPAVVPIAQDPGRLRAAGAFLFTAGLAIAIIARLQLGDNWLDIETAAVKRYQRVVSRGIYGYVRHPIYVGDLILLVGLELAVNSWLVLGAALLIPVVLRQAVKEEAGLLRSLPGYDIYCRRTKRFIPFVA